MFRARVLQNVHRSIEPYRTTPLKMPCDNNGYIVNTPVDCWLRWFVITLAHWWCAPWAIAQILHEKSIRTFTFHSLSLSFSSFSTSICRYLFAFIIRFPLLHNQVGKRDERPSNQPTNQQPFRARAFSMDSFDWIACIIEFVCVFMRKILSVWHFLFFYSFLFCALTPSLFLLVRPIGSVAVLRVLRVFWSIIFTIEHKSKRESRKCVILTLLPNFIGHHRRWPVCGVICLLSVRASCAHAILISRIGMIMVTTAPKARKHFINIIIVT